jgi:signal transduction histidine kinase
VAIKTGTTRNRPSMMLFASAREHAPRMRLILEEAGFRVESCQPKSVLRKKTGARKTRASGAAQTASSVEYGLERVTPHQLRHDLQSRPKTIAAMLKACAGLSPAVQFAGLALYDPSRFECLRLECAGPGARAVPERLAWERYPQLRVAFENHRGVYVSDTACLTEEPRTNGKQCGGCLVIPLPAGDPVGALILSHKRGELLSSSGYSMILSMAQAMETMLENAVLAGRLRVAESRYRSLLFAAPFLIGLLDSHGKVLEVNPKAVRELRRQGISLRAVIGTNILEFPGTPEDVRSLIAESLQTEGAVIREKIAVPLPRGVEVFRVHAFPLRGRGLSTREILIIAEMITHYQQILDDSERTERLAAIGRVAASLAHEVNNPLQALRSHLELIRSYPLSEEEREQSFRILEREVERLDETTRRVLGFARPAPDILQPVSVTGLLDQALALSKNSLRNQNMEIVTEFPADLPPVLAAAGQLIQVFLNIILNALHAMKGKGRLEIRVRPRGESVEVRFVNDGPPIPPEYLARIFDPFFTTRPEGTGLGLSISHAILQRHRGTIHAGNLPHRKGVEFIITLPFAASAS